MHCTFSYFIINVKTHLKRSRLKPVQPDSGRPMGRQGKSIHTIAVVLPSPNDHLGFLKAVEDLQLQAPVLEFRSEMGASSQAGAMLLPRANRTSIWRTMAIIGSGLNLFSGVGVYFVPGQLSQAAWPNSTQSGQRTTIYQGARRGGRGSTVHAIRSQRRCRSSSFCGPYCSSLQRLTVSPGSIARS